MLLLPCSICICAGPGLVDLSTQPATLPPCVSPRCCCCCLLLACHRLSKDPARWGLVEGDGVSVFYAMVPPWCRSRPQADH
jgi:hypothetical protein